MSLTLISRAKSVRKLKNLKRSIPVTLSRHISSAMSIIAKRLTSERISQ